MKEEFDRVLIVGGGFSGAAVALQLARRGVESTLVESRPMVARGAAYSTRADEHLLNVPAAKMSLWPDDPDSFADHVEGEGAAPQDFVSRRRFGDYVARELDRAAADGEVSLIRDRAVRAGRSGAGWAVTLDSGARIEGRALVLANGNQSPSALPIPGLSDERRIDDPWSDEGRARIELLAKAGGRVLMIGTGLTMVDVALTLDRLGFAGRMTALSRRGQVPRAHVAGVTPVPASLDEVPARLSDAVRWLRARGEASGNWRGAVDGLRPITQALWQRLDDAERERFLRHLRPWWDVHRHRIAPDAAATIERLIDSGRLELAAGRILRAVEGEEGARIEFSPRVGGTGMLEVAAVINCTGPLGRIDQTDDPLLRQMLDAGLVHADALGLGLEVDGQDRLAGLDQAWAVGPMTKGRYWEITAVPDIRVQAERIAGDVAASLAS